MFSVASTSAHVERKAALCNFSSTHHGSALAHASASRPDPWAGSSPRGRRALLRTLKRLVSLRAATSASPRRHRGFLCRRGRKTTRKNRAWLFHSRIYWADSVAVVSWAWGFTDGDIYKARGALGVCVQVIPSPAQGIMLPLFGCLRHSRACRAARPGPSPCPDSPGAAPLPAHTPRPRQLPR